MTQSPRATRLNRHPPFSTHSPSAAPPPAEERADMSSKDQSFVVAVRIAVRHPFFRRTTMRWAKELCMVTGLLLPSGLLAQATGRITGTVIDSGASRPLSGARIQVVGTPLGATTNA